MIQTGWDLWLSTVGRAPRNVVRKKGGSVYRRGDVDRVHRGLRPTPYGEEARHEFRCLFLRVEAQCGRHSGIGPWAVGPIGSQVMTMADPTVPAVLVIDLVDQDRLDLSAVGCFCSGSP